MSPLGARQPTAQQRVDGARLQAVYYTDAALAARRGMSLTRGLGPGLEHFLMAYAAMWWRVGRLMAHQTGCRWPYDSFRT